MRLYICHVQTQIKAIKMRHYPEQDPSVRAMILKQEVLDMRLSGVFPDQYTLPFFTRFPELDTSKGLKILTDVINSRSADE